MDLRRAKYILPNLFTLSSVAAGVYSIHLSTTAQSVAEMTLAAWLIVVSMVCDGFDGRVARMTRTESELGIQLDSLADAISFGVAPAFLLYHWGMSEWGWLGFGVAIVYVCCAVLRLARFNVLAQSSSPESKRYFLGLPTPLAAGTIVSVVLAHLSFTETAATGAGLSVAAMALLLSGLMVSNVKYRTFKDLQLRGKGVLGVLAVLGGVIGLSVLLKPSVTLVLVMAAYIVLGLGGGIVSVGRGIFAHGEDEVDEEEELLTADGES
jgi:CDP-diacylglycerol---serine O-phosphatidyltransferase